MRGVGKRILFHASCAADTTEESELERHEARRALASAKAVDTHPCDSLLAVETVAADVMRIYPMR
jgi:hypothetical protein